MKAAILSLAVGVLLATAAAAQTFHGYTCTEDCSGHEAGYNWAEQNDITDSGECGGNSQSFIEGCQAYADEHADDEGTNEDEDQDSDE